MLIDEIKRQAANILGSVIRNRRHLHANPELSFQETQTSKFVKAQLDEMGIAWKAIAGTGVLAQIKGELPSEKVIALRADMDALPISENGNAEYTSMNQGVMHACGHDAHTSSLLGTASILNSLTSKFGGTVKLLFQPGEEILPGGATLMIKGGALENPRPSSITGQHVTNSIECGKIGIRKGKVMASMDELRVTVYGKGGHGAMPHQNIDPVVIASHIIIALQQIVSRFSNPLFPTVLSFGKVTANGAINVIPDEVKLEGTFRTIDETWRAEAHDKMIKMATGVAESLGGSCDFIIDRGYPVLSNEEKLTDRVTSYAREYLGDSNVVEMETMMAAEDFAWYSQITASCFYFLGTGNKEKGIDKPLHYSCFDIDENALAISTGLMAYLAIRQLMPGEENSPGIKE